MYRFYPLSVCAFGLAFLISGCNPADSLPMNSLDLEPLSSDQAMHFAGLAARCIQEEYPNKLSHVMNDSSEVISPQEIHPAFYGCFDWHSSVHGHWMLIRLLRTFPDMPEAPRYRKMIAENLTQEKIREEAAYFLQPGRKSFERTYGWAWLLKLAEELHTWDDPEGKVWRENLRPLESLIIDRYKEFLPKQTYAIRTGLHPNTAFGLSFAWDYAQTTQNEELAALIRNTGMELYAKDTNCPIDWEPGGSDFLSPCLEEANLMRKLLPKAEFYSWFQQFAPNLKEKQPQSIFKPATVADRSDPQIVHLDGLNLSRAWCMQGIASVLPAQSPEYPLLRDAARLHLEASLPHIASGNYEGEHWLASFAVYALSMGNETL
ncbi:MAG: DUF2891 domain-containing protein [Bacteroidota bacterium]